MAATNRTITIREFGRIYPDGQTVFKKDIDELRAMIDEQNSKSRSGKAQIGEFLKPIRSGVQANTYVGVLQTHSGLTVEILPKIAGRTEEATDDQVRQLFLEMLQTVRHIKGKTFNLTNLNVKRNNLLEVFIAMFTVEVNRVIKRGLKSAYIPIQSNEAYLKGKLLIKQQIQKNIMNQARFFSEHDEFIADSPENQLLKTTLEYLMRKSRDSRNQRTIRQQLAYFEQVSVTHVPDQCFQKVQIGRNYNYYEQALAWCRVFLSDQSFTSFRGNTLAFAILFPMDKIFEAYIADQTKRCMADVKVSAQDRAYTLFDKTDDTKAAYSLRPDLVLRYATGRVTVLDTKWKVLERRGPSQADLYQMYAYYTRYHHKQENVDKVVLIYPYSANYTEREFRSVTEDATNLGAKVQVKFVDLLAGNVQAQLAALLAEPKLAEATPEEAEPAEA